MQLQISTRYSTFKMVCGLLSFQIAATAVAQVVSADRSELPRPPGGLIFPTELVQRGAVTMIRPRGEIAVPPGFKLHQPIRFQIPVGRSLLGEVPIGQRMTIVVDPRMAPIIAVVPPRPNVQVGDDFLVLDAESRLLAAVTEDRDEVHRGALPSAIGTSRLRSKRYSERELEWAWWAFRNSYASNRERLFIPSDYDNDDDFPPVGLMELILRFENYDIKLALLEAMRRRKLSPVELDVAEIALYDVLPEVQADAAHLLLDQGRPVDPRPLLAALENYDNDPMQFRVLGPLVRMRHPRARSKLLTILTDKEDDGRNDGGLHWYTVRDISASDNQNMPQYLCAPTLERLQSDEFAWLRSHISDEDLKSVFGFLWSSRVVEFEPVEEWEYLAKSMLEQWSDRPPQYFVRNEWEDVERLLATQLEGESRERVMSAVRAWLSKARVDDRSSAPNLISVLAALGDQVALDRLVQLFPEDEEGPFTFTEGISAGAMIFIAHRVAPIRDPRALDVLLRMLRRALIGWHGDDTGTGPFTVRRIAELIQGRGATDRTFALDRLKRWNIKNVSPHVRWAFGEPPTHDELLTLKDHSLLSLVAWDTKDYQDVLPALRAEPIKHCTALAVLGDVSAAEAIGRGMLQSVRERQSRINKINWDYMGYFRGQRAVERLQSPDAVAPLCQTIEILQSNLYRDLAVTIGRIEEPARLDRLIRLIERSDNIDVNNPGHQTLKPQATVALLIALGRKP